MFSITSISSINIFLCCVNRGKFHKSISNTRCLFIFCGGSIRKIITAFSIVITNFFTITIICVLMNFHSIVLQLVYQVYNHFLKYIYHIDFVKVWSVYAYHKLIYLNKNNSFKILSEKYIFFPQNGSAALCDTAKNSKKSIVFEGLRKKCSFYKSYLVWSKSSQDFYHNFFFASVSQFLTIL